MFYTFKEQFFKLTRRARTHTSRELTRDHVPLWKNKTASPREPERPEESRDLLHWSTLAARTGFPHHYLFIIIIIYVFFYVKHRSTLAARTGVVLRKYIFLIRYHLSVDFLDWSTIAGRTGHVSEKKDSKYTRFILILFLNFFLLLQVIFPKKDSVAGMVKGTTVLYYCFMCMYTWYCFTAT